LLPVHRVTVGHPVVPRPKRMRDRGHSLAAILAEPVVAPQSACVANEEPTQRRRDDQRHKPWIHTNTFFGPNFTPMSSAKIQSVRYARWKGTELYSLLRLACRLGAVACLLLNLFCCHFPGSIQRLVCGNFYVRFHPGSFPIFL